MSSKIMYYSLILNVRTVLIVNICSNSYLMKKEKRILTMYGLIIITKNKNLQCVTCQLENYCITWHSLTDGIIKEKTSQVVFIHLLLSYLLYDARLFVYIFIKFCKLTRYFLHFPFGINLFRKFIHTQVTYICYDLYPKLWVSTTKSHGIGHQGGASVSLNYYYV